MYVLMYSLNITFAEKQNEKRTRRKSSDPESDLDGMLQANYNVYKLPHEFITAN